MTSLDVLVVGAGLAGLACARDLAAAGKSVRVLEARDRVGGRTWSKAIGRATFDLGGQWIGPTQDRAIRLAEELGVATFPTFCRGKKVLELGGRVSTYDGTIPRLLPHRLLALHFALRRVEKLVGMVDLDHPEKLRDFDAMTLADWERRHVKSRAVRALIESAVRVVLGAEAAEISMLHFLFYARSGGGLMRLVEIENGAQERRFVGGAQSLARGLADRLGDRVVLNAPVRAVASGGGEVVVATDQGEHRAKRVVVAVPPAIAARIAFSPALPAERDQLLQRMPMGGTVKCLALYDRAFWREKGLSGEVVSDQGPASVIFDNTSHDGAQPALLAFVVGAPARKWASRGEAERRDAVLAQLARAFGAEAARPTLYTEHDWATEEWTRGCPVGLMPPGTLSAFAHVLRAPCGPIHWAGTETARTWHGFMEGALESGERAAREVLAAI